jgi:hypothetical protein
MPPMPRSDGNFRKNKTRPKTRPTRGLCLQKRWLPVHRVKKTHKGKACPKKAQFSPYSQGELNYIIDCLIHPFFKESEGFRLLDGLLHGLVERNPTMSLEKFVRYNLSPLMGKNAKNRAQGSR